MESPRYLTQSQGTGPGASWVLHKWQLLGSCAHLSALPLVFSDPSWSKGELVYGHWLSHSLVETLVNSHHHPSWLLLVLWLEVGAEKTEVGWKRLDPLITQGTGWTALPLSKYLWGAGHIDLWLFPLSSTTSPNDILSLLSSNPSPYTQFQCWCPTLISLFGNSLGFHDIMPTWCLLPLWPLPFSLLFRVLIFFSPSLLVLPRALSLLPL